MFQSTLIANHLALISPMNQGFFYFFYAIKKQDKKAINNMKPYDKPWLSYEDQLNKLKQRGLIVTDEDKAISYLERIGYYRLSGYWFPFKERDNNKQVLDDFKPNACFKNVINLYVFDKKLRLLVLDALERIEVALRVDVSHSLGKKDVLAHVKAEFLANNFNNHDKWKKKHEDQINRSKEKFIEHYRNKYGVPLPIWVACEVWDFGSLSVLFSGMIPDDKNAIAKKYGLDNGKVFESWLRSLNYLRNVCAHHSRLWNLNIVDQPKLPKANELNWVAPFVNNNHAIARPFLLLCIVKHLLDIINPSSTWKVRLKELLDDFPDLEHLGINLEGMGVMDNLEGW